MLRLAIILILLGISNTKADGFDATLGHIQSRSKPSTMALAAMDLIRRIIPERASEFQIIIDTNIGPANKDTFHVQYTNSSDAVTISASSGVAAASGFHYYLKYFCNCHISWDGDQLALPTILPPVDLLITSADRFRYYQNVCTTSYSFVWWDWERWEREIDWMALNGINLALAFNGQEAIWQRVYLALNMTQQEIDEHFSGPAFLSWNRMGNMRGWGGPLPSSWHEKSLVLQHKILSRMRELSIIPVLPAFAGHVPRAFKRLFPEANLTKFQSWNNFEDKYCCPYLLEPTDPLFNKVGPMFIKELIKEFGTDHIYNCDTFNEMQPSSGDETFLGQVSKAIYDAMVDVDSQAIWILQGWLFLGENFWTPKRVEAFLTSVPMGKMIVLDLQSEQQPQYKRLNSYFGQPFIWCMLHNFGGTLGLFGTVDSVNKGVFEGRNLPNGTMIGTGLTPEGINQNYVMYDLMNEMGWVNQPMNLTSWFSDYAKRRYGEYNDDAEYAWQRLKGSCYNVTIDYYFHGQYVISSHPTLQLQEPMWYSIDDLVYSWEKLLNASSQIAASSLYRHDLVDVTRQSCQILADHFYVIFVEAFKNKNYTVFKENSEKYLEVLDDLDLILGSKDAFLLGPWLESAKACATNEQESQLYEFNARNQITLWGPRGEIRDYANKQWSGIVSHYFQPRWKLFIKALNESLLNETPFNQTSVSEDIFLKVEQPFTLNRDLYPTSEKGDSVNIAKEIYRKWSSTLKFSTDIHTIDKKNQQ